MIPFLARARNGGLLSKELLQLSADGRCVVIAGDFAFDFVEGDVAVVAAIMVRLFRLLDLLRSFALRVDVLFVVGRRLGVRRCTIGDGFWATSVGRCFGHLDGLV